MEKWEQLNRSLKNNTNKVRNSSKIQEMISIKEEKKRDRIQQKLQKAERRWSGMNPNSSEVRGEVILEMVSNPVTSMSQREMPTNTTPKSTIKAIASKKKPTRNPAFGKRKSLVASGSKAITAKTSKKQPTQNPLVGHV